jgi:competence protein ComEC
MRQQFSRFGLQHLLAISGFHFAITACFLNIILIFMFPMRIKNMILLLFLAGYSFFLGPYPSVLRAWMMCSLSIAAQLIDKKTTALNSLGIALLGILAYNPLLCLEVSFKLSFGITAAILLFYQPISAIFDEIIPKRRLNEVLQMNYLNQYAYCILAFLRGGFALTVAVNLLAIPLSLYYFDKFPWMSLIFNLFIPFLAAGSICLFLLSGILFFLPWLSSAIMQLNEAYSSFILKLLYHTPASVDSYLTVQGLPHEAMLVYVSLIFALGIWVKEKRARQHCQFQFL